MGICVLNWSFVSYFFKIKESTCDSCYVCFVERGLVGEMNRVGVGELACLALNFSLLYLHFTSDPTLSSYTHNRHTKNMHTHSLKLPKKSENLTSISLSL